MAEALDLAPIEARDADCRDADWRCRDVNHADRRALLAEVHRLRAELDDLTELADAQRRIASERERPYVEQWRRETGKANTLPDYGDLLHWVIGKNEVLRGALTAYPFGGLAGLLTELETSMGYRFECARPEDCGPLGCLLAKIYHAKKAVEEALR